LVNVNFVLLKMMILGVEVKLAAPGINKYL
jgi:hypothetical protein